MLSLVIPVYRNEESLADLLVAVQSLSERLGGAMEAIFVVDGSPDRCHDILSALLPSCGFRSQLVLLARNFGSFAAIRAGMEAGQGERFAVMAADLQEPPELALEMNAILQADEADIVLGVRTARMEPWRTRLPSQLFWALYRRYVVPEMPPGGVDMFACNKTFRDTLLLLEERHSSLVAQIFWLGFRRKQISYVRLARRHGQSAWTLRKKINYLMDSVFAFSDLPIRLLLRGGAVGILGSILMGFIVVAARLSEAIHVPGYSMIVVMIVFFGALNLFSLGIVGSYAWRAYENTKARPLTVRVRAQSFRGVSDSPIREVE